MKTRDDYVAKLKVQLDHWNEDVTKWEEKAKVSHVEAKKQYTKQLDTLRAKREEALYSLKLLEGASTTAWTEFSKGADDAWERMREAVAQARTHFEKH
jgi:hypothetical protein